jgi:hypothetical protein
MSLRHNKITSMKLLLGFFRPEEASFVMMKVQIPPLN